MPVLRITMRKIKEVLRLKLEAQLSHAQIAAALGISKGVVTKYVGLATIAGLDLSAIQSFDEITLERQLLVAPKKPAVYSQPDYGRIHQELRRKGMTLMLLWEEHRADHADSQTHSYTQFCVHYRRFAKQLKRSMRQIHRAGEKLFIDFAGPTMALTDGSQRVPRLQEELRIRHGSGTFGKWLIQLAKTDVLVLDDWGMGAIDSMTRSDLLEIIDDRASHKATIITSQLPIEHWHAWIGDATIADAVLDRIMQRHHRFNLTGDSLRQTTAKNQLKEKSIDLS